MLRDRAAVLAGAFLLATLAAGGVHDARAIQIQFDYTYATGTFVDDPQVQALLDTAAAQFTMFTDTLDGIDVGGVPPPNTWDARITNPTTGVAGFSLGPIVVPDDTLIVFVGARDLGGTTAGQGGPGGYGVSYTTDATGTAWLELVQSRGESGVFADPASDFGPWGGAISFDTDTNWNLQAGLPAAGQVDFLSVAVHELAHVFGFGSSDSWIDQINFGDGTFRGASAMGVHGGPVPLEDAGHWADDFFTPEPALDPTITTGTRKLMTPLDYAGLRDIGWDVPLYLLPEPDTGLLIAVALLLLVGMAPRRPAGPTRPAVDPRPRPRARAKRRERRRSRGWAPARG